MRARTGLTAVTAASAVGPNSACGSCSRTTTSPSVTPARSSSAAAASISVIDLNNAFTAMDGLKSVAAAGKGSITVILPDTISSTRDVEFEDKFVPASQLCAGSYARGLCGRWHLQLKEAEA